MFINVEGKKKLKKKKGVLLLIFLEARRVYVCCGRARKREKVCGYDYWGT